MMNLVKFLECNMTSRNATCKSQQTEAGNDWTDLVLKGSVFSQSTRLKEPQGKSESNCLDSVFKVQSALKQGWSLNNPNSSMNLWPISIFNKQFVFSRVHTQKVHGMIESN